MKSNHITYDHIKSFDRVNDIISASDNSFEELNEIPPREKLTYTNGFYVNCSALFVDIRASSQLPKKHTRPKLAKLYRVYLSEIVAIMNGNDSCAEINIEGDSVSGIYNTPYQLDINKVFNVAAKISSLIDVINYKFKKKNIEQIEVGIGLSYGRALMIKAGYNGSGINDIVWMGDVVNEASKLSSHGNKTFSDHEVMLSDIIYENLYERNQELLSYNYFRNCYGGDIVCPEMDAWYKENCRNSDTFSFF